MPLSALFARPTVEHLAAWLHEEGAAAARAQVLAVQAGGRGDRSSSCTGTGPEERSTALPWPGPAGPTSRSTCWSRTSSAVEGRCRHSRRSPRPTWRRFARCRARGPYRLGGFCNGGLLAYEMARQLEEEGEEVEFLGLVNPSVPVQSSVLRTACRCPRAARTASGGGPSSICGPAMRCGMSTVSPGPAAAGWRTSARCWRSSLGWNGCSPTDSPAARPAAVEPETDRAAAIPEPQPALWAPGPAARFAPGLPVWGRGPAPVSGQSVPMPPSLRPAIATRREATSSPARHDAADVQIWSS